MAAAPFALFAYAERSLTAGLGSIINATTPLWTAIILAVWLRQAPTARRVAAIVVGFAGVGIIVGLEGLQLAPDALVGVVAATAGAASYGLALTYMRRRMAPQPPLELALGQLIAASIMLAPFALLSAGDAAPSGESIVAILGLGIFSTAIAWPILFRVNREVGPMATSTVTFLNPVFGALWGALFLAESISPTFLLGAAPGLRLVDADLRPADALRPPAVRHGGRGSRPPGVARRRDAVARPEPGSAPETSSARRRRGLAGPTRPALAIVPKRHFPGARRARMIAVTTPPAAVDQEEAPPWPSARR